jgi:tetratricopeptide (TPR) repeat protein
MGYKIRTVKKTYKEPLEVLRDAGFLAEFFSRYRSLLLGLGALAALAGLAALVIWQISLRSESKAWALEAEANRLFRENPELTAIMEKREIGDKNEHFKKSLQLYREIVQKYPRTSAAPVAAYYIGNVQFELKEFDNAIQSYQAFLSRYGGQSRLTPLVQSKLAYLYQQTGKEQEALKLFQTVMGNDRAVNQDQAYYEVGRIYEGMGVEKEAIAAYEKAAEKFKNSPWAAEAQARLAILKPEPASAATGQSTPSPVPSSSSTNVQGEKSDLPMVKIEKGPDGKMIVTPVDPKESPPQQPSTSSPAGENAKPGEKR